MSEDKEIKKHILIRDLSEDEYHKAVRMKDKLHCKSWREWLRKVFYIAGES